MGSQLILPFLLGVLMNYYTCLVLYCIKEVLEILNHSKQQTTGPLTADSNQDKLSFRERYTASFTPNNKRPIH